MLRDTRKTADYFRKYIAYQQSRIERFEGVLQEIAGKSGNTAKNLQCHMYLMNFYQDLLLAEYSYGSDAARLRKIYAHYLIHARAQNSLSYDAALNVLSWAVLLDVKNSLDGIQYPQDGLLEAFFQYLRGNWPLRGLEELPVFLPVSGQFLHCLTGKLPPEGLKDYIKNDWYESNSDAAWYESDQRDDDTYCGYWCLTGAAVIKIMEWNPGLFADTRYCPIDLLL